ncbi:hypothetical protein Acsp05_09510 [Actinokineospora sp. NBRC 105648]|nr:hypothetical protein Acsp05_09510 [Actinokineospora sp. NBRC 105648]
MAVGPGAVGRISPAAVSNSRSGRGVPATRGTGWDCQVCMPPTVNVRFAETRACHGMDLMDRFTRSGPLEQKCDSRYT